MSHVKKQILDVIFKYIPKDNIVVFLFGSTVQGQLYPSSDIDIGIISSSPLKNSTLVRIKEELKRVRTLRDIDIVDFSSAQDSDFLKVALKEVKIWHQTKKSKVYLNNLKKHIRG